MADTPDAEPLYIAQVDTYLIYDHRVDGFHEGARRVSWDEIGQVLPAILARARAEKRSVIVTNPDDFCLYHLDRGVLVFPTPEEIAAAKKTLT